MVHIAFETRVPQQCIRVSNLPMLSSIVERAREGQPLKDYTVLNIQHQLGDVAAQTEALLLLGASPSDLYFLPPMYTHHKEFESFVQNHYGVPRDNFFQSSTRYRLRYNYDKYRLLQVIFELNQMCKMELAKERCKPNKLLVLDDGGCFSEALATLFDIRDGILNSVELIGHLPLSMATDDSTAEFVLSYLQSIDIRLVEQTSRGLFKYLDQQKICLALEKCRISIIDVASSEPKRCLEPPLIAEACLNMLAYLFYDAPAHLRVPKPSNLQKCLLLGYGAIGRAIGYSLVHDGDLGVFSKQCVHVWDRDEHKNQLAKEDGFRIFDQWSNKAEFDYIVGCAGRCSLPVSSLPLLRNNGYLISVSSAAIEFPFDEMIESALSNAADKASQISLSDVQLNHLESEDIHRNITFQIGDQSTVTIVNGGMPITFLGLLNPATPEKFDLTVSCMVAGSIQAAGTKENHGSGQIVPLDSEYSRMICNWVVDCERSSVLM